LPSFSFLLSEVGRREEALVSAEEAVSIYRRLAEANPAAYLPSLARVLNNLVDRLDGGPAGEAAWEQAGAALPLAAARGELRAAWARRLAHGGHLNAALEHLSRAAADVDSPQGTEADRAHIEVVTRARHAIRALVQGLQQGGAAGFPVWATAPLPEAHLTLVNAVHAGTDILLTPEFRQTLLALVDLYPGHAGPTVLLDLLQAHDWQVADAWIATPTWTESMEYHRTHLVELSGGPVRDLLAAIDHDDARQHAAILDLADRLPLETVYTIVTDAGAAERAALAAVEDGDLDLLPILATASPALHSREPAMDLLAAVLLLARGEVDQSCEIAKQIAEQTKLATRRAFAGHLHGLHRRRPEIDGLDSLIAMITSSDP
jgi:hypothetical protein